MQQKQFLMRTQVAANMHKHIIFFSIGTGAHMQKKKLHTVDFEKWSLAATSHPVQSNPDVTRKELSLLPSD